MELPSKLRALVHGPVPSVTKKKYQELHNHALKARISVQYFRERLMAMFHFPNRRRKALCIGINGYVGVERPLNGCNNDAQNIKNFLMKHGYRSKNIVILSDCQPERYRPTKHNIEREMEKLVKDAKEGDRLFLHYSGHGDQEKDTNGDEVDGMDEVLVPLDASTQGNILDDYLYNLLVKPLPKGCKLTALMDCCHSGTSLDLPYKYECYGQKDEFLKCSARADLTLPSNVIAWASCRDKETSREIRERDKSAGILTNAFIKCLEENPKQTYQTLYDNLRIQVNLQPSSMQVPQLGASNIFDASELFIF